MILVANLTKRVSVVQYLFIKWVCVQGQSSDTLDITQNASGPVGILLKGDASGARWLT